MKIDYFLWNSVLIFEFFSRVASFWEGELIISEARQRRQAAQAGAQIRRSLEEVARWPALTIDYFLWSSV